MCKHRCCKGEQHREPRSAFHDDLYPPGKRFNYPLSSLKGKPARRRAFSFKDKSKTEAPVFDKTKCAIFDKTKCATVVDSRHYVVHSDKWRD